MDQVLAAAAQQLEQQLDSEIGEHFLYDKWQISMN